MSKEGKLQSQARRWACAKPASFRGMSAWPCILPSRLLRRQLPSEDLLGTSHWSVSPCLARKRSISISTQNRTAMWTITWGKLGCHRACKLKKAPVRVSSCSDRHMKGPS